VLDAESYRVKNLNISVIIKRLVILLLIIFSLVSLIFYLDIEKGLVESSKPALAVEGDKVKPFIETHYQRARWYSLVESIETQGNRIIIKTFIYPDEEGHKLANEIVDDLENQGIDGDIVVYGRNMSYYLLSSRGSQLGSIPVTLNSQ
jgi:hypothetical protein